MIDLIEFRHQLTLLVNSVNPEIDQEELATIIHDEYLRLTEPIPE